MSLPERGQAPSAFESRWPRLLPEGCCSYLVCIWSSNAPASHLCPLCPGRGSPRSSVRTVHFARGTSSNAELDEVMAAVSGPFEPFVARLSGPISESVLTMLVDPNRHELLSATL